MIYTWEPSFHWQLYVVNQGLGLICTSRLEGSTETKFPAWLFTEPRETLAFTPHLCQLRFLYCSPNGQGLRWGGQSGNFFTFLPKPEETLFLESCGKECMQTAECFGKLVSKHLECLSSPYFKTADFCFLKADPPVQPYPFSFTLLFFWPPKPCSFPVRTKRSPTAHSRKQDALTFVNVKWKLSHTPPPLLRFQSRRESSISKMICAQPLKQIRSAVLTVYANVASGFWKVRRLGVLLVLLCLFFSTSKPSEKGPIEIQGMETGSLNWTRPPFMVSLLPQKPDEPE